MASLGHLDDLLNAVYNQESGELSQSEVYTAPNPSTTLGGTVSSVTVTTTGQSAFPTNGTFQYKITAVGDANNTISVTTLNSVIPDTETFNVIGFNSTGILISSVNEDYLASVYAQGASSIADQQMAILSPNPVPANLTETFMKAGSTTGPTPTPIPTPTPVPTPSKVILNGTSSQYIVADDNGSLYVQDTIAGRDGTQTLSGVNAIQFTDGIGVFDPTGSAEDVARIYGATLGRGPDVAGLEYWTAQVDDSKVPLSAVASSFTGSPEFIQNYGSLSDPAFINQLYENVLGRAADTAGAQYWGGILASGATRGTVVLGFAESPENDAKTISTTGDVNNAEAYRLYQAALNRAPDASGLSYWSSTLAGGATPTQVAQDFIGSPEFQKDYGALTTNAFVSTLYQNVLHRAADPTGLQYWTGQLQQGSSEASVLVGFSDSLENRTQTAGATHANWVFVPS